MSYDCTILLRPSAAAFGLAELDRLVGRLALAGPDGERWLLSMRVDLIPTRRLADAEVKFSLFPFTVELTASTGALSLIHPVGLWLAGWLSEHIAGTTVFMLAGVERLGAEFVNGRCTTNKMAAHQDLYAGTGWHYAER